MSELKYTKEILEEAVMNSNNLTDVLLYIGLENKKSGMKSYISTKIKKFEINTSHFNYDRNTDWKELTKEEFIKKWLKNDTEGSINTIKNRIIKFNLIPYQCKECFITNQYNGKKIVLQLDHKNGINTDNRIENLRFLCPNCHSQTNNFAGRNNKY
jgi:Zn finger protein HypA/HybF involved in hydrogenase expression